MDRQRGTLPTEDPLEAERKQSMFYLLEDTSTSHRNRFAQLGQVWSISRFDEISQWNLSDLHPFVYSSSLPTTGNQDVTILYVVQRRHKGMAKVFVFHSVNYLICMCFRSKSVRVRRFLYVAVKFFCAPFRH